MKAPAFAPGFFIGLALQRRVPALRDMLSKTSDQAELRQRLHCIIWMDLVIEIITLGPQSPELATCAKWRVEAFGVIGKSVEEERLSLAAFAQDQNDQVALAARLDGRPAGTCLLVPSEIKPIHAVAPWLAGLYVAPEFRRRGVGEALVASIETEARRRRHSHIYLYSTDTVGYYARLGWSAVETVNWMGNRTTLMMRGLLS